MRSAAVTILLVATFGLAACESPTDPSSNVPFQAVDLVVGAGAIAANGNTLAVHYTGWLYDPDATDGKGQVFDSTSGSSPYTFVLGSGQVIAGWEQGIPGMREGGVRRLVIPPNLAYGSQGNGPIPPNTALVFEIQLVSVLN